MQAAHSPRALKERQRQEREALILQAAEEVLMEKGYHETSIDEIAARVGVAKGTIYLHFPSKEDLVIAIFARGMQNFLQELEKRIVSEQTSRAKLEAILRCLYGSLFGKYAQLLYSMYNNMDVRRLFDEKESCMHELWDQLAARVRTLLEEGKTNGEFDTEIPIDVMLSMFFSLLSPRGYERLLRNGEMVPEALVSYLARIYFHGIAATKTSDV
jgi:TetR/AcrR family fatty acid metabolism transcriptional regulator